MGLSGPVPARVPAEGKKLVLKTVDHAVAAGFTHTSACWSWQVGGGRVHRAPGGHPMHVLLPAEIAAILDIAERWGEIDRSHRKLAHRGSYEQLVWVSPSTSAACSSTTDSPLPEPQPRSRPAKRPRVVRPR